MLFDSAPHFIIIASKHSTEAMHASMMIQRGNCATAEAAPDRAV